MVGPGFSQAVQDIIFFVSIDFRPGHNYIIKAYYSRESGIQLYKVDADYSTRDKKKKKNTGILNVCLSTLNVNVSGKYPQRIKWR